MTRLRNGLASLAAVLIGVSPLLWVTFDEYRAQLAGYRAQVREQLVERATRLVVRGDMEQLAMLVRETKETFPDDTALAEELVKVLMRGSHTREFRHSTGGEANSLR